MTQIKIPIQVHFDADVIEELVKIANRKRCSRAEIIREAVNSYVNFELHKQLRNRS